MKKAKSTGTAASKARKAARPAQKPNLRMRLTLMRQLTNVVRKREWTQAEAAGRCGVSQPRMNDLLRGRVSRFSLDALVNIAAALGVKLNLVMEERR